MLAAQNSLTLVGQVVSITPSRAKAGGTKLEIILESPTKDRKFPLRFRAIAYGQLAENLPIAADDWCIASGRLESAIFGQGKVGMMLLLRDIFKIEANVSEPFALDQIDQIDQIDARQF